MPDLSNYDFSRIPEAEETPTAAVADFDFSRIPEQGPVTRAAGRMYNTLATLPLRNVRGQRALLEASKPEELEEAPFLPFGGTSSSIPGLGRFRSKFDESPRDLYEDSRTGIESAYGRLNVDEKTHVNVRALNLQNAGETEDSARVTATVEFLTEKKKNAVASLEEIESNLYHMPTEFNQSTGWIEDLGGALGFTLGSLPFYALSPAIGGAATFQQLLGAKAQELDALDVTDPQLIFRSSLMSAALQTPLESLGDIIILKNVVKLTKGVSGWRELVVRVLGSAAGEAVTEFAQEYPDQIATIIAVNHGMSQSELYAFIESKMGEITLSALYNASLGAAAGGGPTAVVGTAQLALDRLVSPQQAVENEANLDRVIFLSEKAKKGSLTAEESTELKDMLGIEDEHINDIVEEITRRVELEAPIESDVRTEAIKTMREQIGPEKTDDVMVVFDAMARVRAQQEGGSPADYYGEVIGGTVRQEGVEGQPLFQFAGPQAVSADQSALASAVELDQSGRDMEEIRKETGWHLGVDDKWRFEIDDSAARLRVDEPLGIEFDSQGTSETHTELNNVLKHPALFQAYPQLDGLRAHIMIDPDMQNPSATYSPKDFDITVWATDLKQAKTFLLHETQHAIQELEGFARGGSPSGIVMTKSEEVSITQQIKEYNERLKASVGKPGYNELLDARQDLVDYYNRHSPEAGISRYQRLAGEIEARDTESRADMTAEERGEAEPFISQGIPKEDAIVLFRGGEARIEPETPRGAFDRATKIISLFESADVTTALHEMAHARFQEMFRLKNDDYYTLADWAGVSRSDADSGNFTDAQLEKVGKGFERYMIEGQAPTARLQEVFQRIKEWFLEIYKSVQATGIDISDDVRKVFDRWIALEHEIAAEPLLEVGEWLKVDTFETGTIDANTATIEDIESEARSRVLSRVSEDREKADRKVSAAFRKQAKAKADEMPIYQFFSDIRDRGGINYDELQAAYDDSIVKEIVKRRPGIVSKTGVHPVELMAEYGYTDLDLFVSDILETPRRSDFEQQQFDVLWGTYQQGSTVEYARIYREIVHEEAKILEEITGVGVSETSIPEHIDPFTGKPYSELRESIPAGKMIEYEQQQAKIQKRALERLESQYSKEDLAAFRQAQKQAVELTEELGPALESMAAAIQGGRINHKSLLDSGISTEEILALNRKRPGLVAKDGEVWIDRIAEQFGYDLPTEIVQAWLDAPTVGDVRAKIAADLVSEYDRYIDEARDAEFYDRFLEEEIAATAEIANRKANIRKDLQKVIREQTGQEKPKTIIEVDERTALNEQLKLEAKAAREAYRAGKKEEAARLVNKQKKTIERIYQLKKDQAEQQRIARRMKRYWRSKTMLPEFKAQIVNYLSDYYNIPPSFLLQPDIKLDPFLESKKDEDGYLVNAIRDELSILPQQQRNAAGARIPLAIEDLQTVARVADMLAHMERIERNVRIGEEKLSVRETVEKMLAVMYSSHNAEPVIDELPHPSGRKGRWEKFGDGVATYNAELKKVEFIVDEADGWEYFGPNYENIFEPIKKAEDAELALGEKTWKKVEEAFAPFGRTWGQQKYRVADRAKLWTKEEIVMVMLNTGNTGNLAALVEGFRLTEESLESMMDIMTTEEWDLVHKIWAILEELYPFANAVHQELTGVSLKRVDGTYFPLAFDPELSWRAARYTEEETQRDLFASAFTHPTVTASHRKLRTGGKMAPFLQFSVITKHITNAIHDATHQIPVRNVQKLIGSTLRDANGNDLSYRAGMTEVMGKEAYAQLAPWLAHVARPQRDPQSIGEKFAGRLRRNMAVVALGLKISVGAKQGLSITQAVDELSHTVGSVEANAKIIAAAGEIYADAMTERQKIMWIQDQSPMMRNRWRQWDREFEQFTRSFDPSVFQGSQVAVESFFAIIGAVDAMATYPAWLASYNVGLEKFDGNNDPSVEFADKVVRKTQPVASPKDLSTFQRGGLSRSDLSKLFTSFMTFFAVFHNRMNEVRAKHKLGKINMAEAIVSYWWILIMPATMGAFIQRRRLPEGWEWIKDIIGYRVAGMPWLRDIISPMLTGFDYTLSPVSSAGKSAVALGRSFSAEDDRAYKILKHGIAVAGYGTGMLPSSQMITTMDGIIDLMEGKTTDPSVLLLREKRKPKKKKKRRF